MMTETEKMMLNRRAWQGRREQLDAVLSCLLKIEVMGLTLRENMVECPPPANIHPSRWRAMLIHADKFSDTLLKGN